jgi:YgiT-type zinc finger domain-containing protein
MPRVKSQPKLERCAVCGGQVRSATVDSHEEPRGADLHLFRNVPAQVCQTCGEVWIAETTLQDIDRLIERGTAPTAIVETPVYDLSQDAVSVRS